MSAMPQRQIPASLAAPSRAEVLQLVSSGSLAEVLWPDNGSSASPANELQQRLLQAYIAVPSQPAPVDHLPMAVRTAIICGTSIALWFGLGGFFALAIAFM